MLRIIGYGDVLKPYSFMALIVSRKLICPVAVFPCVMIGSLYAPSQQSNSTQRQFFSKSEMYRLVLLLLLH